MDDPNNALETAFAALRHQIRRGYISLSVRCKYKQGVLEPVYHVNFIGDKSHEQD